tara:strand:+ start:38466 stop:39176 length:711 start_codon:yes stop_codon:yes gene_type:complete
MSAKYTFLAWDTQITNAPLKLALLQLANNADDAGFSYYSISKMAVSCGMSDRTFMRKISELEEMNILTVTRRSNRPSLYKLVGDEMGVTLCHSHKSEVTESHPGVTESHLVGDRESHDLNSTPNTYPKSINISNSKFNFKLILVEMGADKEAVSDWMEVRKNKKASNTKTALKGFLTQVEKAGITVAQAVEIAAEKSWCGFQASWYEKINKNGNKNKDIMQISSESSWEEGINDIF